MRTQKFGIEIEMTGITRAAATQVIAGHFSTSATHVGGIYDAFAVRDGDSRQWKVVSDSSIRLETRRGQTRNTAYAVEFVSPICKYEDIGTIQEIIRKLRAAGAKVNSSCGIHIHIDASPHDVKTLRNIVNIMAAKEDLLYKTLKVDVHREHYCAKADTRFLDELNAKRPTSMDTLESIWYNGRSGRNYHYDESRYHGLNLHSVFSKGTIEFRLFNSTLHAGEIKSYIQLCMAISHQALVQKSASRIKTQSSNEKYTFRVWLLRLGLIGDEFKTARHHLLKNLDGNIAWKDPAQAEAQKQRLAEKRLAESVAQAMEQVPALVESTEEIEQDEAQEMGMRM
ncbi:amidoligase family protein [Acutalibacter caecimuris]|uniref:amidoligase family protein n=1 Tax=Acutalibacter caecimuris TaxID=3093657 RepID=UPI002AC906B0|nr:amidoligase family protein [Acutalibacter sp. M00118]